MIWQRATNASRAKTPEKSKRRKWEESGAHKGAGMEIDPCVLYTALIASSDTFIAASLSLSPIGAGQKGISRFDRQHHLIV